MTEDLGTTKRRAMSGARRLRIWESHKGVCGLCDRKITSGDPWIIEHRRALVLGGADTDANCVPVHKACADAKTHGPAGDLALGAKAKRVKAKHVGAKPPSRTPLPFGRGTRWKKKMDGSVVRRKP
jgi:5-methylcytosine-specific restriction protein A